MLNLGSGVKFGMPVLRLGCGVAVEEGLRILGHINHGVWYCITNRRKGMLFAHHITYNSCLYLKEKNSLLVKTTFKLGRDSQGLFLY